MPLCWPSAPPFTISQANLRRRASSSPAPTSRSIIRGEQLTGAMVHTIFEWRKFIGSFEDALDTSGFLLLNQSLVTLDFLFGWFRTAFASVTGNRKLRHDFRQHVHALVKSHQGNSLIITVHALQVFVGQGERHEPVSLDVVQPQLRGVR